VKETNAPLAVITGSAGAIGGETANLLASKGWRVIGLDIRRSERPDDFLFELVDDVSQESTWEKARASVNEAGGELHGLVHAAAYQVCTPLIETTENDWHKVMATNLGSFYLACHTLHGTLAKGRGSVVAVGSVHARATSANIAAYAASKGGLSAMVRALAIEWAGDGIRVNAVLPGAVDSAMLRDGLRRGHLDGVDDQALLDQLASRTVNGRIGQPEEIAQAIDFFLDESKSSFATGSELVVDGGATIRLSTE
jgi:NAD(P)-dependent dehydrogenase (short-subunit alcohol dehydrogenase family)